MGGLMSRNKGKRGEREIVDMLQAVIDDVYSAYGYQPPKLKRNSLQSDGGGSDIAEDATDTIAGLAWAAIEVKYHETFQIPAWWRQAVRQAGTNKEPILLWRKNHAPWTARVRVRAHVGAGHVTMDATITIDDFLKWFRVQVVEQLEAYRRQAA